MSKTLLLMKMALINLFSNNKFAIGQKNKKSFVWAVLLVPAAAMLYLSVVYSLMLINVLPPESRFIMPVLMSILTFLMLVMLTFLNAGGHLFGFRDFDLLMSLPVKRSSIMMAKLLAFLLMEYLFAFFLMAPYLIVYGLKMNQGIGFYFIGFIGFVFMPIVPLVISGLLAFIINGLTGNFRFKSLFRNVFYILLFGLVMFGSMQMQQLLFMDLFAANTLLANLQKYLPVIYYLSSALINLKIFDLLIYVVINIIIFTVFIVIFNRSFVKINVHAHEGYKVKNFRLQELKVASRFKAYFALQVKRYFGSTMYLINTIVGPLMLIVFMLIGSFSGVDEIKIYLSIFEREGLLVPILSAAILFTSSICMITASTISLEGKNINMLKSLPLSITTIFQAKIALQVVITMVVNIVAIIMGILLYDISIMTAFILTFVSLISSVLYAVLGLIVNLLFPKMEWDSETIVVKQSMSVIITMIGSMLIAVIHVIGYLFLIKHIPFVTIVTIFMVLDGLIIIAMWRYLLVKGAQRFISL